MRKIYLALFILGVTINIFIAVLQNYPGYMDADYYLMGGEQLANGNGFHEMVLWNYLDGQVRLPHPSNSYWMPLSSILTAIGLMIGRELIWGRMVFILMAGAISSMTAYVAYTFSKDKRGTIFAGLIATFSGFYLPFIGNTDTFGIYMLCGSVFLLLIQAMSEQKQLSGKYILSFLVGMLAGLMHLSRADGILWLGLAFLAVLVFAWRQRNWISLSLLSGIVLLGYLVVMGPWLIRNWQEFGTLLSPGGIKVLWLTNYDELFAFPADKLNYAHWWSSGVPSIIKVRFWSLGQNLQTTLAVQGSIFLLPFILIGLWQLRRSPIVVFAFLGWISIFFVMTVLFPFAGARGGYLHSGAAFQIVYWAVSPLGLESFIRWGNKVRRWPVRQSRRAFSVGLVLLAIMISGFIVKTRVIGDDFKSPAWRKSFLNYQILSRQLDDLGVPKSDVVMINNPPGFYLASGHPAVVIPYGDLDATLSAARAVDAKYLILEQNHVEGLKSVYEKPNQSIGGLKYLKSILDMHIFAISNP